MSTVPAQRAALLTMSVLGLTWLASPALAGPRIVIDPGHGGQKEGAHGPGGVLEKDVSLNIALQVKEMLEASLNAEVYLTRDHDTDITLMDRVDYANRKSPDLFLSIHANSMPTRTQRERTEGIETYFLSASASGAEAGRVADRENAEGPAMSRSVSGTLDFILSDLARSEAHVDSSRLAYAVHQKLVTRTQAVDRGVQQAPFYVLTGVEAPAVLIEVGFVSHPREGRKLANEKYQAKLAESISEGVRTFLTDVAKRDRHVRIARP